MLLHHCFLLYEKNLGGMKNYAITHITSMLHTDDKQCSKKTEIIKNIVTHLAAFGVLSVKVSAPSLRTRRKRGSVIEV